MPQNPALKLYYTAPCDVIYSWNKDSVGDGHENAFKDMQIFLVEARKERTSLSSSCEQIQWLWQDSLLKLRRT